jgi:hypothetical protein
MLPLYSLGKARQQYCRSRINRRPFYVHDFLLGLDRIAQDDLRVRNTQGASLD